MKFELLKKKKKNKEELDWIEKYLIRESKSFFYGEINGIEGVEVATRNFVRERERKREREFG